MNRVIDKIVTVLVITGVLFVTPLATWIVLNVTQRSEMITVAVELPQTRKGIVEIWEPMVLGGDLGPAPEWYVDYEAEQRFFIGIPDAHYNMRVYSVQEHACMAKNIYFEARNESIKGQMAVALVTLERVQNRRYPNNVCEVIYENKQFSWYWDGLPDHPKNTHAFEQAILVASAVMNADIALYDFTYNSTHYHANYVQPWWSDYMVYKATVDTHIFYREEPEKFASL